MTRSRKQAQLDRLLNAAAEVVAEHGLDELTVRRVCARASVAETVFYELFASGEDCAVALFDRTAGELGAVAKDARVRQSGWVERARAGMDALLRELEANPWKADLIFPHSATNGPRSGAQSATLMKKMAALLEECVGVGEKEGVAVQRAASAQAGEPRWLGLLFVIGANRELSTRAVGRIAGIRSERQVRRLMAALANLGLAEDANADDPTRRRSAWRLTDPGMEWLLNVG
jgi:AcrR family transcriptional regulator